MHKPPFNRSEQVTQEKVTETAKMLSELIMLVRGEGEGMAGPLFDGTFAIPDKVFRDCKEGQRLFIEKKFARAQTEFTTAHKLLQESLHAHVCNIPRDYFKPLLKILEDLSEREGVGADQAKRANNALENLVKYIQMHNIADECTMSREPHFTIRIFLHYQNEFIDIVRTFQECQQEVERLVAKKHRDLQAKEDRASTMKSLFPFAPVLS